MDATQRYAVSGLLESAGREDFAIHLYSRQLHRDPFATVPLMAQYYVLDEVYPVRPVPVILWDLLGIMEVEIVHRQWFLEAAEALNPGQEPVPRIVFPEDLFHGITPPETEPIPGLGRVVQAMATDIVQEQRADAIYRYFARETSGPVSELFRDVAEQEQAHRRIFEQALAELRRGTVVDMWCPICGKTLKLWPRLHAAADCGFCGSRFTLGIEAEDFILQLRADSRNNRRHRILRP